MLPKKWRLALLNWLGAGYMRVERDDGIYPAAEVDCIGPSIDVSGLAFNVMPANGGTIVQIRNYDEKNSRNNYTTHIIAEGQDVAENVGKIVAMELWKV